MDTIWGGHLLVDELTQAIDQLTGQSTLSPTDSTTSGGCRDRQVR